MFEGSEHPFSSYFGYSVNRAPGFWYVLTHHHFAIASIASIFALPMPEEPPERIGPWSFVASLVCLKTGYPKSWWSWFIHDFPCKYCFILLFISIYFLFPSPSDQVRLSLSVFMYLSWLIPLKLSAWWCFEGMPHFHTQNLLAATAAALPRHQSPEPRSHHTATSGLVNPTACAAMDQWTRARKQQKMALGQGSSVPSTLVAVGQFKYTNHAITRPGTAFPANSVQY